MYPPSVAIPAPTVSPSVVATPTRGSGRFGRLYPITVTNGDVPAVRSIAPLPPLEITTGAPPAREGGVNYWNWFLAAGLGGVLQSVVSSNVSGMARFSPVVLFSAAFLFTSAKTPNVRDFMMVAALTSGVTAAAQGWARGRKEERRLQTAF